MKHSIFRSRRGFTLTELIAVIAIVAILVSLAATGYFALRKSMRIAEYDDIAREIYVAAQNRLTSLRANGLSDSSKTTLQRGKPMGTKPSDYDETASGVAWSNSQKTDNTYSYYYADNTDADILDLLLPLGSVDDTVRSNGCYVIEYNVSTGMVYGVFYSETEFSYTAVSAVEGIRTSQDTRKSNSPMVGYYGGSAVAREDLESCDTPELTIENTDILQLTVANGTNYTVSVMVSDGTTKISVGEAASAQCNATYNKVTGKLVLDELDGAHFYNLFPTLTSGADITITVTFSKDGMLSSVASVTTNSLFASREDSDTGAAVEIAYARQLQNLEGSISGLDESSALSVRQTADIDLSQKVTWDSASSAYVSKSYSGTFTSVDNAGIAAYDGQYYTISNLRGTNGLFAAVENGTTLSAIRIVNPTISAGAGTNPVGALVGTAGAGTIVDNCGVYCDAATTTGGTTTVSYSEYSGYGITASSATVGGLIGSAEHATITSSFAALPFISAKKGGALVGSASYCDIKQSYAACDSLGSTGIAYFLSGSNNSITLCYAVGNLPSENKGVFVSGSSNTVKQAYYAVSHTDYSKTTAGEDLAATEYATYSSNGTKQDDYTYEEFIADGGVATVVDKGTNGEYDKFSNVNAPLTHPYRQALSGRAYPYPGFYMMEHYGSWPTGDGTVKIKVYMRTTTGGTNYAYSAGQVQVWALETDEDGNESQTLLFDNRKAGEDTGTYTDGYDSEDYKVLTNNSSYVTVSVVPGTDVRVVMTEYSSDYKISGLQIGSALHTKEYSIDTEISEDVTIESDTTITATYRPGSYTLTLNSAKYQTDTNSDLDYKTVTGTYFNVQWTENETSNVRTSGTSTISAGTTVTVQVTKYPENTPRDKYTAVVRYSNTDGETILSMTNDTCTFTMPSADTTIEMLFVLNTDMTQVTVQYWVQGTDGNFAVASSEMKYYMKGTDVDTDLAQTLSAGSGKELTVTDELGNSEDVLDYDYFELLDTSNETKASDKTESTETSYTLASGDELTLKIYISREQYALTLVVGEKISSVSANDLKATSEDTKAKSITYTLYYGQSVTVTAEPESGRDFNRWDAGDETRFAASASSQYTFTMPHYNLTLTATAEEGAYFVQLELLENGESWLASSDSRKAYPISIKLVNSTNEKTTIDMTGLADSTNSYIFQATLVNSVTAIGQGYYVLIQFEDPETHEVVEEYYYTTGGAYYGEDGVHQESEEDDRLVLTVREKGITEQLNFYTVTYYPNSKDYSGTVPETRTYPANTYVEVKGNPGLLVNNIKSSKNQKQYLVGWRDGPALTSGSILYSAEDHFLLTQKTSLYAEWESNVKVRYEVGEKDDDRNAVTVTGGTLPLAQTEVINSTYTVEAPSLEADGYEQVGWTCSYEKSCPYVQSGNYETCPGHKKDDTITLTTNSLVLTAKWEIQHYTVTYYDEDGTKLGEIENVTIHSSLTADSYKGTVTEKKFVGWAKEKNGTVSYAAGQTITGVTENLNLYAVFAENTVTITFYCGNETATQTAMWGTYVVLNPDKDGDWTVTAWTTESDGTGQGYLCEEGTAHTASTVYIAPMDEAGNPLDVQDYYAITGNVLNYNQETWYDTLYDAVNAESTTAGDTLIVYRDTTETNRIVFTEELYVIASGDRTVKWTCDSSALNTGSELTIDRTDPGVNNQVGNNEFRGCMFIKNCAVTFGEANANLSTLKVTGTLTFDANQKSRVMALKGSNCTFTMVDGVTLQNGLVSGTVTQNARISPNSRQYMGGGVYAADGAYFNMEGGTISYCQATAGGGVYIVGQWKTNKWNDAIAKDATEVKGQTFGSYSYKESASFSMGNMEHPTYYSSDKIYYYYDEEKGAYLNVETTVTVENYTQYFITTGNPQIINNTAKKNNNSDGGGGVVLLEADATAINLFSGSISNNTAEYLHGGGIILDTCENGQQLRLYEITISNNKAYEGAGIYQYQGTTYIYNADISQNQATGDGGGIYAYCASTYKNYSGAIHSDGNHEVSQILFYYGTIRGNAAGSGKNGGGIYLSAPNAASLITVTVYSGQIMNNTAKDGGGIYVTKAERCANSISDLVAKYGNGQIYNIQVNVNGGEITNNTATRLGAGVYLSENSRFYLNGGYLSGNKVTATEKYGVDEFNCDIGMSGTFPGSSYARVYTTQSNLSETLENDSDDPIYVVGYSNKGAGSDRVQDRIIVQYESATPGEYDPDCFAYENVKLGLNSNSNGSLDNFGTGDNGATKVYVKLNGSTLILTTDAGTTRTVVLDPNYTEDGTAAEVTEKEAAIDSQILYSDLKVSTTRNGYDLMGWSKVADADLEDYIIYYQDDAVYMSYSETLRHWQYKAVSSEDEDGNTVWTWYSYSSGVWTECYQCVGGIWSEAAIDDSGVVTWTEMTDSKTRIIADISFNTSGEPAYTVTAAYSQKLYAQWQAYSATYELGSAPSTISVETGNKQVGPDIELRGLAGGTEYTDSNEIKWTFMGWSTEPGQTEVGTYTNADTGESWTLKSAVEITLSESVTFYAVWQPEQVIITYDVNGGNMENGSYTEKVPYGTAATAWGGSSYKSADTGNILAGWATTREAANAGEVEYTLGQVNAISADKTRSSLTLYAVWKPIVNVKYVAYTDEETVNIQSFKGGTATLPKQDELAERKGYTLVGWSETKDSTSAEVKPGGTIDVTEEEVTYYGVWQIQVTFSTGSGTIDDTETQKYTKNKDGTYTLLLYENAEDKTITLPDTKWNGGTFVGWMYTNADGNAVTAGETYEVTEPITFTASWQCTVKLNANGGSFVKLESAWKQDNENYSQTVAPGASVKAPDDTQVTRTGYVLSGWSTTAGGDSVVNNGESYLVSESVTLYAVWTPNDNTVTLNANGGKFNTDSMNGWTTADEGKTYTQTAKTDGKITLPDADAVTTEDAAKTLAGWATTKEKAEEGKTDAGKPGDAYTVPGTSDNAITLYAVWVEPESDDSDDATGASLTDDGTDAQSETEPETTESQTEPEATASQSEPE